MQDIWFISCICFILLAISEYAACLYLKRNLTRKKREAKLKLIKELVAKVSKEEEDQLRQKEEQKLFVVRTFAENMVSLYSCNRPPTVTPCQPLAMLLHYRCKIELAARRGLEEVPRY